MRIAVITSGYLPVPPTMGGAVEVLTQFYLEENEKYGKHEFTVYSINHQEAVQESRQFKHCRFKFIHHESLFYRLRKKWFQKTHKTVFYDHHTEFFLHNVLQDLQKQAYDVIIVENKPGFVLLLSEATTAKIILHLHNDHLNATTPHAQTILERCHKIITVSDYIKGRVASIEDSNKIVTVHNGIDLSAFHNARPIERASIGFEKDDFILVFSGRLNADKGIKELLEAMLLLKDYPKIKLLVLGGSFFGNETGKNDFITSLKKIALPLKDKIVFTGFIPYKDVPSYLSMSDVAVVPSIWDDPFPTSVLEAMACGLPLICTRSGGIPEEVNKDYCILIERSDVISHIKEALFTILYDYNKQKEMGKCAKQNSTQYSKERYAHEFLSTITNRK